MVVVAQLVRAPDCGSGGRGFESPQPPFPQSRRQFPRECSPKTGQFGMESENIRSWENAEVERSAGAAGRVDDETLKAPDSRIQRYMNPPLDTWHSLEYCFALLGNVRGQEVLEYGCGDGVNTLLLALRGAKVKALDISPDLIEIAKKRLEVNQVEGDVEFIVGSAHDIPLPDKSIDIVFGVNILHHLDLQISAEEILRILKGNGRAIFQEPVRNSSLIKLLRKMVPYRLHDISPFERPLTDKELIEFGRKFSSYSSRGFSLPTTEAIRRIPFPKNSHARILNKIDRSILRLIPALKYFSERRVVELIK